MKAVIIEDEERSRIVLQNLIETYCPEISVAGVADSVDSGVLTIRNQDPDVIFLDVQLSGGTGFDVLENIRDLAASVIFTTAYDHYALKAFKFSAIDYLLKPIDIEELKSAVQRATEIRKDSLRQQQIRNLVAYVKNPDEAPVLLVTVPEAVEHIHIPDIMRCEAKGDHTVFYLKNHPPVSVDKPIADVEYLLADYGLFRTHAEHIVNIKEVRRAIRSYTVLVLSDDTEVPLSASRKHAFLKASG